LEAALNQAQTDTLIKFVRRCISKPASFTLNNHAELCKIWEGASNKLTAVSSISAHNNSQLN
jgi:ribose 1,5-bisphosphokinase PhnN